MSFINVLLQRGLAAVALLAATTAASMAAVTVSTAGSSATAVVALPGGIQADFRIDFDSPSGLDPASVGIDAKLVSLTDPVLLARLPDPSLTSIPSAFPVLITVEPPAAGGLSFENTARIELHTHNLVYVPGTRLRLFKAPLGGSFVDITEAVEPGSVRTRGRTGGFSQFLVLVDLRDSAVLATSKLAALDARLDDASALSTLERAELEAYLANAGALAAQGMYADAIAEIGLFRTRVRQLAGSGIPNVWRAERDLSNLAGDLDGAAASLAFTWSVLRDGGS